MSRLSKTKVFAVKLKDSQKLEHSSSGGRIYCNFGCVFVLR